MNQQYKQFPAGNPLANILVVLVGALAIGVSVVLGVVAFVILGGLVVVLAALLGVRAWWLNRRLRRQYFDSAGVDPQVHESTQVLEGEYRVIESENEPGSGA